jgi:hypothetical protein
MADACAWSVAVDQSARYKSTARRSMLRGDQAIVGITGSVAAFRKRGFVPSLLQLQLHNALLFTPSFHVPPFGLYRRFDRHRLHGAEKFSSDRGIDP